MLYLLTNQVRIGKILIILWLTKFHWFDYEMLLLFPHVAMGLPLKYFDYIYT
jgi:uncharacterized membrane protein YkgB